MVALFKLSARMFRQNWKRNLFNVLSITIAVFFISSLLLLYKNYECAHIENAYASEGTWDYCIEGASVEMKNAAANISGIKHAYLVNYSLTAQLDPIVDDEREGLSGELTDNWLLSLIELEEEASEVLSASLLEGIWPTLDTEIVVPRDFIYDGKKLRSKEYKIGDTIELPVGKRLLPGDIPTQEAQLSQNETFEPLDVRTFRITGVVEGDFRKIGNYVETAYIGNPSKNHDKSVLYLYGGPADSSHFEALKSDLAAELQIPAEQIKCNDAVRLAMRLIETSNISKQYKVAGIALIAILSLLVCTIVITSQAFNFQANQREFAIIMVNGCSRRYVGSVLWVQNLFVYLLSALLSIGLNLTIIRLFSDRISSFIAEQGERYSFTTKFYVREILLIHFFVLMLVSILPFLFMLRIDIRNLRAYMSDQSIYNQSVVSSEDTNLPVWIRSYARKKVTFVTLALSILMSVIVIALGLVATRTILLKSQSEINQYAADFYVVKSLKGGDAPRGELILSGLPEHLSSYHYVATNAEFDMPNDKLTRELKTYYRNTDQTIRTSTELYALNEDLFHLIKGNEIIDFKDFSEQNIAIFFNQAYLKKEHSDFKDANSGFSESVQLQENAPFFKNRIIDISTYESGDSIYLNRICGEDESHELKLAGTTRNFFGELYDDAPGGGLYVSYKTFFDLIGDDRPFYEIMLISTSKGQNNAVSSYLVTAASKYGYHVQDNSNLTKTVRISSSIQLTFIYSLMGLAVIVSLLNSLSIWGFEAIQQKRMMVIRRVFGQSRLQGVKYMFFSKLFVVIISAIIFVIVIYPLINFNYELFDFYGISLLSAGAGLFVAILLHIVVLFIISLIEIEQYYKVSIGEIL